MGEPLGHRHGVPWCPRRRPRSSPVWAGRGQPGGDLGRGAPRRTGRRRLARQRAGDQCAVRRGRVDRRRATAYTAERPGRWTPWSRTTSCSSSTRSSGAMGYLRPEADSVSGSGDGRMKATGDWRPGTSPACGSDDASGHERDLRGLPAARSRRTSQITVETLPETHRPGPHVAQPRTTLSRRRSSVAHIDGPPDSVIPVTFTAGPRRTRRGSGARPTASAAAGARSALGVTRPAGPASSGPAAGWAGPAARRPVPPGSSPSAP